MKVKFTELNSGYEGERRVSRFSGKAKARIIIAATLFLSFVIVLVLSLVGIIPFDAILLRIRVSLSGEDKNFPIETNTDSIVFSGNMDDSVVILTSENVIVYSSKGKESYSQPHSYANPGIDVNGERAVVFDRSGSGFFLLNEKEYVYEGEADNNVLAASYGEDGTYALATLGDKSMSVLTAYNKKNDVVFKWNCSHNYISDVVVSDNGKYIGVSVVGAENGEIFSSIYYFGVEYDEPLLEHKITGAVPVAIDFTEKDVLTVVTDIGVYTLDNDSGSVTNCSEYYSSEFLCTDFSDKGNYIVAIAKYGSRNVFEVNLFSASGECVLTVPVNQEILSAYVTDKYIVILADNQFFVYNFKGELISAIQYTGEAFRLMPTDDFIYIVSLDKIFRCFTYGDSSVILK